MTNWKHTINISNLHQSYQTGNLTVSELAMGMHQRLTQTPYYESENEYEFQEITDWFKDVAEDAESGEAGINDYDSVLSELYNWGDYGHRLFVSPFD